MGLKQEELAKILGISQAVVSNVENGVSAISVPILLRMMRSYESSGRWVLLLVSAKSEVI
ncbi:MAG: helix-turn-helix transcriptional regulator [Anaerolineae bacterium]|nr:helix-turn-helix transcriptional regulator [Anaerolineae bacterium]